MTATLTIENNAVVGIIEFKFNVYNIVIPTGVTAIAGGALKNCNKINFAVLPETLNRIGRHAFADCSQLSALILPDSLSCNVWYTICR